MAKYDPLYDFLDRQTASEIIMSFGEIERIINSHLPKYSNKRDWWGNEISNSSRHVQKYAWMNAGFRAEPDLAKNIVVFRR